MSRSSIVILNWNGAEVLRRYLPSVVRYSQGEDVEIVVADNGSTDESLELLEAQFPSVRRITLGQNYGFAEGYNRALAQIDSTYCVLLNSDVEVTEGWLTPLLDYLDNHPEVAAVMPKVRSDKKRTHFEHAGAAGGYVDRWGYPYCRGRILGYVEEDKGQYDTPAEVLWTTGAAMCVRTDIYRRNGGLDADFFAHMEEIDFCWRLACRGWKLMCLPQSVVYHLGGGALAYESPRKTYLNFRNNLLMLYKNLPAKRLHFVLIMRFVLDYIAAIQLVISGKKENAKAVVKARLDFLKMRPQYAQKRQENLQKTKVQPMGLSKRSILIDYYLKGMRH